MKSSLGNHFTYSTRPTSPESESLWSVRHTAAFLDYADGTVRNLIAKGKLPRIKLATGATRIPSEAVRAFAAHGRSEQKVRSEKAKN